MIRKPNDPYLVKMGHEIRKRRHERGFSLHRVASMCNIHYTAISRIECGFNGSKITTLKMIADVLGCDVKDFL